MTKQVSAVYGDALFEIAAGQDRLEEYCREASSLRELLKENEDFRRFLAHPEIIKEEKLAACERIFSGRISDEMKGLLQVAVAKDRQNDLDSILAWFIRRVKEERGIASVEVTSAVVLTERQKRLLEKKILETSKARGLESSFRVDESLLGGLVIRMGDRVVDSSIRTQLEKLKRQLSKIHLEEGTEEKTS